MSRISPEKEFRIYQLKLKGYSNREVHRKLKVATGTVSNSVKRLKELWQVGELPVEYGVRDRFESIMALAVELRKSKSSLPEAIRGAKLLSKLSTLKVDLKNVQAFIRLCRKLAHENGYVAEDFVQAAMRLMQLEEKSGRNYHAILNEYEEKTKEIETLESIIREKESTIKDVRSTIRKLKMEEKERKVQLSKSLTEHKLTLKQVVYVGELQQGLLEFGLDLEQVDQLHVVLKEVEKLGKNPRKIVNYIERMGSLEKGKRTLEEEIEEKQRKLKNLQDEETDAHKRVNELTAKADRVRKEIENLEIEAQDRKSEILELTSEEARIRKTLAWALGTRKNYDGIMNALNGKKEEAKTWDDMIDARKRRVEKAKTEIQQLMGIKGDVKTFLEHIELLKNEIQDLEDKKKQLMCELDETRAQIRGKDLKIKLAEFVSHLLYKEPKHDFDVFFTHVSRMKEVREKKLEFGWLVGSVEIYEESLRNHIIELLNEVTAKYVVSKDKYEKLKAESQDNIKWIAKLLNKLGGARDRLREVSREVEEEERRKRIEKENEIIVEGIIKLMSAVQKKLGHA